MGEDYCKIEIIVGQWITMENFRSGVPQGSHFGPLLSWISSKIDLVICEDWMDTE